MDVFQHFACHTKLPIHIDDVLDHVLEQGVVEDIALFGANLDPNVIRGFVRVYEWILPYGTGKCADVYYSTRMPLEEQRLIACKELLHILDDDVATGKTREVVDNLISEVCAPLSLTASLPGLNDHVGIYHALMILLPRDALDVVRPRFESGELTAEAIAEIAQIPVVYVEYLMSPAWKKVLDGIE